MKKILIIIVLVLSFLLCGCNSEQTAQKQQIDTNRFYDKDGTLYRIDGLYYTEVVDKNTGNIYLSGGYHQGLCPFYNNEGKIANIKDSNK